MGAEGGEATRSISALKYRTIAALFEMKIIYAPFMPRPGFKKKGSLGIQLPLEEGAQSDS